MHRHVVGHENGPDVDAVGAQEFGGEVEVHHVARVILDDEEHAAAVLHRTRRRFHLIGHGAGEHFARTGGIEHTQTDKTAVQRFVARATARNERDLSVLGRDGSCQKARLALESNETGMSEDHAFAGFIDERIDGVDQFFHIASFSAAEEMLRMRALSQGTSAGAIESSSTPQSIQKDVNAAELAASPQTPASRPARLARAIASRTNA